MHNLGGGVFAVEGRGVERMVIMTEWENEEALAFLQKRLVKAGVESALLDAGARDGDEIRIAGRCFDFDTGLVEDPEVEFIEDDFVEDDRGVGDFVEDDRVGDGLIEDDVTADDFEVEGDDA